MMPCFDPTPDDREKRQKVVAQNLVYLGVADFPGTPEETKRKLIKDAKAEGYDDLNGGEYLDEWTAALCKICRSMTEEEQEKIIYNGRNPKARKLADWWDDHKKFDEERDDDNRLFGFRRLKR